MGTSALRSHMRAEKHKDWLKSKRSCNITAFVTHQPAATVESTETAAVQSNSGSSNPTCSSANIDLYVTKTETRDLVGIKNS
jgi:hypothetical protein